MTQKKQWLSSLAALGMVLALVPQVRAEEAAKAKKPAAEAKKPAATKAAGPKDLLKAIPGTAWGFAAIPNVRSFDAKIATLLEQLNFPVGSPIALLMGQLGIAEGLREDAGLGVVLLDPMEYGMPPDDLAILVPTTNSKALLEVFEPQDAGNSTKMIDIMGQELFVVEKGGFVVIGMDKSSVEFTGKAEKGIAGLMSDEQTGRYKKSDIYAMVNLRPAIEMAKPLAGQVFAMMMMDQMDADPDAGEKIQQEAQKIVDLLDQIQALELALTMDDAGVQLAAYLTFSKEGGITKMIASQKDVQPPLLAGLPGDNFIVALGLERTKSEEQGMLGKMIMDAIMSRPEVSQIIDKEKMQAIQTMGYEILGNMTNIGVSVSLPPEGAPPDSGMICLAEVLQTDDVKGTMAKVKKVVEAYKGVFKDETAASVMSTLAYKSDAEKIGDVSVDHITLDLSKAAGSDPQMQGAADMAKKILGEEGVLVRLAPAGDKRIVVTLGGGSKKMEQIMKDAAAGKSPLAEVKGVEKVRAKMPRRRFFEMYLGVDELLKVIKTVMGSQEIPVMAPVDAPLGVAVSAEKNYGRLDIILPTELLVAIKDVALQAMFGGGFGGGAAVEPSF